MINHQRIDRHHLGILSRYKDTVMAYLAVTKTQSLSHLDTHNLFLYSVETTFTINTFFGLYWLADPLKRVMAGWVWDLPKINSNAHMTNEVFES